MGCSFHKDDTAYKTCLSQRSVSDYSKAGVSVTVASESGIIPSGSVTGVESLTLYSMMILAIRDFSDT